MLLLAVCIAVPASPAHARLSCVTALLRNCRASACEVSGTSRVRKIGHYLGTLRAEREKEGRS
jgi:hypothetical protein